MEISEVESIPATLMGADSSTLPVAPTFALNVKLVGVVSGTVAGPCQVQVVVVLADAAAGISTPAVSPT